MNLHVGPKTPPLLQLIQWSANPLAFFDDCANRYGDLFTVRFPSLPPFVYISNPKHIEELFTSNLNLFDSGKGNNLLQPLVGKQSLLLLDGEYHRRHRRLLSPPFHGDRMRTYGNLIFDITKEIFTCIVPEKSFLVRKVMQEISLQIILQAVFGLTKGERFQELKLLLGSVLDLLSSPISSTLLFFPWLQQDLGPWSPWGNFLRQQQEIDKLIYEELHQRRVEILEKKSNPVRSDILALMMSARDQNDQLMTDTELRDELLTLLFAGHETTASALAWSLYWIHSIPNVFDNLLQEINGFGNNLDALSISKLPYLNAVCQETLRIYPVIMQASPRIVKAPIKILDRDFDTGTYLTPSIYLTHHREELYPEPKSFKPERFLERQFSPYEYLPFGGSSRSCIGMAFAQFEMKLVLASILTSFRLQLVEQRAISPTRRGLTSALPNGVRMFVLK